VSKDKSPVTPAVRVLRKEDVPTIYINGGKRGYIIGITPEEVVRVLRPVLVHVGIE
jgi:prolyl-tRNA editing enzyme YbaK/EbsC (Cys-tRNA(Pro) deacylase)